MKIIKPGKRNWWQRILCQCGGDDDCGAELEIEVGDLYKVFSYDSQNNLVTEYAVRCPICREETIVSDNLPPQSEMDCLPERIQHQAWIWDYEYNKIVSDSMKDSAPHFDD